MLVGTVIFETVKTATKSPFVSVMLDVWVKVPPMSEVIRIRAPSTAIVSDVT